MTFLLAGFLTVALVSAASIDNGEKSEPNTLNGTSSLSSKLLRRGSSPYPAAFPGRDEQQNSHPGLPKFRRSDSEVPWFPETIKRLYDGEFPRFESMPESPYKYKECDFFNAPAKPHRRDAVETAYLRILKRQPGESGVQPTAPRVVTVKLPQKVDYGRKTINSCPPPSDVESLEVDSRTVPFFSRFPVRANEDQNNFSYQPQRPVSHFRNGPYPCIGPFWWILYAQPNGQPFVTWFPSPPVLLVPQPSCINYPYCPFPPHNPFLLDFTGNQRGLY